MSQIQAQHVGSEDDYDGDVIQQEQRQRAISTISDAGILHSLPPGLLDDATLGGVLGRSRSNTLFSEFQFSIDGHEGGGHHDIMAEYDASMVVVPGDDNPSTMISWGDHQPQPLNHPGQPQQQQQQQPPSLEQEDVEHNMKEESSSSDNKDDQDLPNHNEDNDETTTTINSTNRRRTSTTKASSTSRIIKKEEDQHEEQQEAQQSQQQQQLLFIRSPSSYETSHFGKRMRSGSLSGRLRSASILEQKGIIDRTQRNLLKDLIISSKTKHDTELQKALDLYECDGDTSGLELLIQNGYLLDNTTSEENGRSHSNTLDFLTDDLDLDFLNVKVADDDDLVTDTSTFLSPMAAMGGGRSHSDSFMARERADSIQMFSNLLLGGGGTLSGSGGGSAGTSLENATQSTYHSWITGAGGSSGPQQSQRVVAVAGATIPVTESTNLFSFSTTTTTTNSHPSHVPGASSMVASLTIPIKQEDQEKQLRPSSSQPQDNEHHKAKPNRRGSKTQKKKQTSKDKPTRQQSNETGDGTNDDENKINDDPQQPVLLGMPRDVLEDPNIRQRIDQDGLLNLDVPEGWIGAYSPTSRKLRLARFNEKRSKRVWTKSVKYDVRKNFADSRLRVKGRFVKKEDEELMRDLISLA